MEDLEAAEASLSPGGQGVEARGEELEEVAKRLKHARWTKVRGEGGPGMVAYFTPRKVIAALVEIDVHVSSFIVQNYAFLHLRHAVLVQVTPTSLGLGVKEPGVRAFYRHLSRGKAKLYFSFPGAPHLKSLLSYPGKRRKYTMVRAPLVITPTLA